MDNQSLKIAVASGKGGVGKSMLTSCLAILFSKNKQLVAVDADVDAPNLAVWLNEAGNWERVKKISPAEKPVIDYKKCLGCGVCAQSCQFKALTMVDKKPRLNQFTCEGCGVCELVCPQKAIKLKPVKNGEIRIKKTKSGFMLITGQLYPGETGSGKIVSEIKEEAEKFKYNLLLIDSAPGTGCPVIAALRDVGFVILVTEPTTAALGDLQRVLEVVNYFHLPFGLVVNKWNINEPLSQKIIQKFKKHFLGKISYDQQIFQAIANLKPIMETSLKARSEIEVIFDKLKQRIKNRQ